MTNRGGTWRASIPTARAAQPIVITSSVWAMQLARCAGRAYGRLGGAHRHAIIVAAEKRREISQKGKLVGRTETEYRTTSPLRARKRPLYGPASTGADRARVGRSPDKRGATPGVHRQPDIGGLERLSAAGDVGNVAPAGCQRGKAGYLALARAGLADAGTAIRRNHLEARRPDRRGGDGQAARSDGRSRDGRDSDSTGPTKSPRTSQGDTK